MTRLSFGNNICFASTMRSSELIVVSICISVLSILILYLGFIRIRRAMKSHLPEIVLLTSIGGKDLYVLAGKTPAQMFKENRARNFRHRAKANSNTRGASSTRDDGVPTSHWDELADDSKFADEDIEG